MTHTRHADLTIDPEISAFIRANQRCSIPVSLCCVRRERNGRQDAAFTSTQDACVTWLRAPLRRRVRFGQG